MGVAKFLTRQSESTLVSARRRVANWMGGETGDDAAGDDAAVVVGGVGRSPRFEQRADGFR